MKNYIMCLLLQGMLELYALTQTNPTLDLDAYLTKSTPFFKQYVHSKLQEVCSTYIFLHL